MARPTAGRGSSNLGGTPREAGRPVTALFVGDVGHQADEPGAEDGFADGPLVDGRGAGAAAGHDAPFAVDKLLEEFDVLIVDVNRTRDITGRAETALQLLLQ